MRSLVSRMLRFLMGIALLASMGLGVAAHANEQMCIPGVEASAVAGHVDGDADQVPADSEKGYPITTVAATATTSPLRSTG